MLKLRLVKMAWCAVLDVKLSSHFIYLLCLLRLSLVCLVRLLCLLRFLCLLRLLRFLCLPWSSVDLLLVFCASLCFLSLCLLPLVSGLYLD